MTASALSTGSGVAAADAAGAADWDAAGVDVAGAALVAGLLGDVDAVEVQPTTRTVAARIVRVRFRCTGVLLLRCLTRTGWPRMRTRPRPTPSRRSSTHGFACDHLLHERIQQGDRAPRTDVVIRVRQPDVGLGQELRGECRRRGDLGESRLDAVEERRAGAADAATDDNQLDVVREDQLVDHPGDR